MDEIRENISILTHLPESSNQVKDAGGEDAPDSRETKSGV